MKTYSYYKADSWQRTACKSCWSRCNSKHKYVLVEFNLPSCKKNRVIWLIITTTPRGAANAVCIANQAKDLWCLQHCGWPFPYLRRAINQEQFNYKGQVHVIKRVVSPKDRRTGKKLLFIYLAWFNKVGVRFKSLQSK